MIYAQIRDPCKMRLYHPGTVRAVSDLMTSLGYNGYMLFRGSLRSISEFDPVVRQVSKATEDAYRIENSEHVSNFMFLPGPKTL